MRKALRLLFLVVLGAFLFLATGCRVLVYNESYAAGVTWRAGSYIGYINRDKIEHRWKCATLKL